MTAARHEVAAAYRQQWSAHRESLSDEAALAETTDTFVAGYPFHPEVLATLTGKTATLATFQRVRGCCGCWHRPWPRLWDARPPYPTLNPCSSH